MKHTAIGVALFFLFAQPARPQPALSTRKIDDLVLLARIWGFLKYYDPVVATGKVAWDDELLHLLPTYRRLGSTGERDDTLLAWIDRQGHVDGCDCCEPVPPKDARLTPDLSWMDDAGISPALRDRLHYILRHRNTGPNYYVEVQSEDDVNLALFRHEPAYPSIHFPDSSYGILCLFRLWNAIEYWYPYKYQLQTPWPEVLRTYIPRMAAEPTLGQYAHDAEELLTRIEDTHGYLVWQTQDREIHGGYMLPFTLKFAGKWFVTSILRDSLATAAGIRAGDILDSIDGQSMQALVERLALETPASNQASLLNKLSRPIIRTVRPQSRLALSRDNRRLDVVCRNFQPLLAGLIDAMPAWFPYPKDSAFCLLPGNIAYLNMSLLDRKDSVKFRALIAQSSGLIIDDRQNADEMHGTNAADLIMAMVVPPATSFVRFSSVQPTFPGVFRLAKPTVYNFPSASSYRGKIAILVDENTTSIGEFISMAFRTARGAKLIGTPTAGADGNVNYLMLPGSGLTMFTGLGVYYPDGRETQRTGLQPDILVPVSLDDYLHKRDVQLARALLYLTDNR